jgi:hypothetical protein
LLVELGPRTGAASYAVSTTLLVGIEAGRVVTLLFCNIVDVPHDAPHAQKEQ